VKPLTVPTPGQDPKPLPCSTGKQQHIDKTHAKAQVASLRRNRRTAGERHKAYRCDRCGFWHAGRR
jgi:hypothetical protein